MNAPGQTVWRITTRRFADTALSGEGARQYGGRWNRPGQSLVCTAESRSLALLEMLVQDDPLRANHVLIPVQLAADMPIDSLQPGDLPLDWRAPAARQVLQSIGAQWLHLMRSAVLVVPSAVVPAERNFLINPAHPDFQRILVGQPEALETDLHLFRSRV